VLYLFAGCSGRIAVGIASAVTLPVPPGPARPEAWSRVQPGPSVLATQLQSALLDNLQTTFNPTNSAVETRHFW